jgi:hypothetical protein
MVLLSLTACDIPKPQESQDEEGATFAIASFEGESLTVNLHPDFSIPVSNNYNFKACLTNLQQKNKSLTGHKFIIEEINKEVTTDIKGCANWAEVIEYNFLAPSKYLTFVRTFKATGMHKGRKTVTFALDPWSHGEPKIRKAIDLSKESVPKDWLIGDKKQVEAALKGADGSRGRTLWLDSGRMYSQEDRVTSNGFEITYDIHGVPQIMLSRMNGEQVPYDITTGKFSAEMMIIHAVIKDGKIHREVLAKQSFDKVTVTNKNLALKARLTFKAPYWGHIYLGLKLAGINAPPGLKPFEGLYYIGDYRSIKANNWLKINSIAQNEPNFSLQKFIDGQYEDNEVKQSVDPNPSGKTTARGEDQDIESRNRIFVKPLVLEFLKADSDNGHRKKVHYSVSACLFNPIDDTPIRGLKFNVTKFRRSESEPVAHPEGNPLTSQQTGCINWTDEIPVEMYSCQQYIKGFIDIENSDLGLKQRINYYINPWASSPVFGTDEIIVRNSLGNECEGNAEAEKPRYIFVSGFEYALQGTDYKLDENLNLIVRRIFNVDIDAQVVNNSDLSNGRSGVQPLRDGMFLVKMVIAQNPIYNTRPEYITSAYAYAMSRRGRISLRNVELDFHNPFDLGNRNSLMVQIVPVDEEKVETFTTKLGSVAYRPVNNAEIEATIDKKVSLTPLVYEGKILLLGYDNRSVNLQDNHGDLNLAFGSKNSAELTNFVKLSAERQKVMDQFVANGKKAIADKTAKAASINSIELFANMLSLHYADLDSNTGNTLYLRKLMNLPIESITKVNRAKLAQLEPGKNFSEENFKSVMQSNFAPRDTQDLRAAFEKDALPADFSRRLCMYWINSVLASVVKSEDQMYLSRQCANMSEEKLSHFFIKEKIYNIRKADNFVLQRGIWERFGISSAFGVRHSFAENKGQTSTATFSFGPTLGKNLPFFSMSLGGSVNVSYGTQESKTQDNGISVSNQMDFEKQRNTFTMDLIDYDVCYRLRVNPELFKKPKTVFEKFANIFNDNLVSYLDPRAPTEKVLAGVNKGILACTYPQQRPVLRKTESFYVVQEKVDLRDLQDNGDQRNRLYITLRGDSDFRRFEAAAKGNATIPGGFYLDSISSEEVNQYLLRAFDLRPTAPRIYFEPVLKN